MNSDNVWPHVDHDRPLDGLGFVRERFENLMDLQLDKADAFIGRGDGPRSSSILKGSMFSRDER